MKFHLWKSEVNWRLGCGAVQMSSALSEHHCDNPISFRCFCLFYLPVSEIISSCQLTNNSREKELGWYSQLGIILEFIGKSSLCQIQEKPYVPRTASFWGNTHVQNPQLVFCAIARIFFSLKEREVIAEFFMQHAVYNPIIKTLHIYFNNLTS